MSKRMLVLVGWVALVGASLVAMAAPASAHGGEIDIEVTSSVPEATGTRFEVRVTYENDGDPIGAATVTAVVTDAAGVAAAPVPLVYSSDGRYSALVPMVAGTSTVRFAVAEPEGVLDVAQSFVPPTAPPATEAPVTEAPTTILPDEPPASVVTSGDVMSPTASPTPTTDDDDDSGNLVVPIVGGAVLAVAIVAGVVWKRRGPPATDASA